VFDKIRSYPAGRALATLLVLGAVLFFGFLAGRASAAQPHMEAALDLLKKAKAELEAADPDKGGHRVEAMRLVTDAILQVEKGIRFDVKH
jgi:hypothetical protein